MTENEWQNKIDDYSTSIQAIVGFANFYLWDPETRSDRSGVTVFQGRRLRTKVKINAENEAANDGEKKEGVAQDTCEPTETVVISDPEDKTSNGEAERKKNGTANAGKPPPTFVTPDLGVVTAGGDGVLAEVKISFPKNDEHWFDDFSQLMSYDADFDGWPAPDGCVARHDIVLITEQGRASKVKKFFEKHLGDKIQFTRPFVIVSCNRSDNRQQYYFFQRIVGKLTANGVDQQLEDGTKVPMKVLVTKYSTVKIYDAEPPLPYMIELIWSQIVLDSARSNANFSKLRKRQKVPVMLDVDDIVARLREGFTFRSLDVHASEGTPAMPHRSWVLNAIEKLISLREAEWIDATKTSVRVFFQMYEDALGHFIKGCLPRESEPVSPQATQLPLRFPDDRQPLPPSS